MGSVTTVPLNVEPMVPNLMLEKVTEELGKLVSMSEGLPEVMEQVPRAIPGFAVGESVGKGASSQSMLTLWSSQIERTRTCPLARDLPIAARPPRVW